jgi:hypothetical protein
MSVILKIDGVSRRYMRFFFFFFLTCPQKRENGGFELVTSTSLGIVSNRLSYLLWTYALLLKYWPSLFAWLKATSISMTLSPCQFSLL